MEALGSQRSAFDVPDEIAYFNTAALAPQLHAVRAAGAAALEWRARPWAISPGDWFTDVERLRVLFARLVGGDAEGVAIVSATSYGFAVAARNLPLPPGARVLVLADEYPSRMEAIRLAEELRPNLVRVVIDLGGESGLDVARDLAACARTDPDSHFD